MESGVKGESGGWYDSFDQQCPNIVEVMVLGIGTVEKAFT